MTTINHRWEKSNISINENTTMFVDQKILPDLKYRVCSFPVKIPTVSFVETDKMILNAARKHKGVSVSVTRCCVTSVPRCSCCGLGLQVGLSWWLWLRVSHGAANHQPGRTLPAAPTRGGPASKLTRVAAGGCWTEFSRSELLDWISLAVGWRPPSALAPWASPLEPAGKWGTAIKE